MECRTTYTTKYFSIASFSGTFQLGPFFLHLTLYFQESFQYIGHFVARANSAGCWQTRRRRSNPVHWWLWQNFGRRCFAEFGASICGCRRRFWRWSARLRRVRLHSAVWWGRTQQPNRRACFKIVATAEDFAARLPLGWTSGKWNETAVPDDVSLVDGLRIAFLLRRRAVLCMRKQRRFCRSPAPTTIRCCTTRTFGVFFRRSHYFSTSQWTTTSKRKILWNYELLNCSTMQYYCSIDIFFIKYLRICSLIIFRDNTKWPTKAIDAIVLWRNQLNCHQRALPVFTFRWNI